MLTMNNRLITVNKLPAYKGQNVGCYYMRNIKHDMWDTKNEEFGDDDEEFEDDDDDWDDETED